LEGLLFGEKSSEVRHAIVFSAIIVFVSIVFFSEIAGKTIDRKTSADIIPENEHHIGRHTNRDPACFLVPRRCGDSGTLRRAQGGSRRPTSEKL
jgi:hypothetical protein